MICLLLIMTMIFINGTESAEQKVRHSDTLLKEEDMNAKTKAWLLMVESGKVDQEELRRITPKSIFIAPLLTSRTGKCKEGYRHDHLGQCVKVIKIDPQVQLELLLQKLNKLYGEKKGEKEEKEELFQVSSGPLHFSLPISNSDEKAGQTAPNNSKPETQVSSTTANTTSPEIQNIPEFIPIPLPMVYQNQTKETNQTKEIESSGAEPLNETESYETSQIEGSGEGQPASGDGLQEEESTTPSRVSLLPEETDYLDVTEADATTFSDDIPTTTEFPEEDFTTTEATVKEVLLKESYQNLTNTSVVNKGENRTSVQPEEDAHKEITAKTNANSERIYFPSDDDEGGFKFATQPPGYGARIRFPDEVPQQQVPSYLSSPDSSTKSSNYQIHSNVPREQFWWLPKNWQIDENQHKSALVKVWSRLPLIHDITYSRETPEGFKKSPALDGTPPQVLNPQQREESFSPSFNQQHQTSRNVKPFKSSRFQDILITPRQNFRFQR